MFPLNKLDAFHNSHCMVKRYKSQALGIRREWNENTVLNHLWKIVYGLSGCTRSSYCCAFKAQPPKQLYSLVLPVSFLSMKVSPWQKKTHTHGEYCVWPENSHGCKLTSAFHMTWICSENHRTNERFSIRALCIVLNGECDAKDGHRNNNNNGI